MEEVRDIERERHTKNVMANNVVEHKKNQM